jgi:hypothetical protein
MGMGMPGMAGMNGMGGMGGAGGFGGAGGMGGAGGQAGFAGQQGMFMVPTEAMMMGDAPPVFDKQQYLAERRAYRAAQAEQREQRLAQRKIPKSRSERPANRG